MGRSRERAGEAPSRWRSLRFDRGTLAIGLVGLGLTLGCCWAFRAKARARNQSAFDHRAEALDLALRARLAMPFERMRSMPPYFAASGLVERAEFYDFVRDALVAHPEIAYFAWAPFVEGPERAAVEASADANGWPGFEIREPFADGTLGRARSRASYLPLLFVEPPNEAREGMDLSALPHERAEVPARALERGTFQVSPAFRLDDRPSAETVIAAYAPLARGRLASVDPRVPRRGLAMIVVRVAPIVRSAIGAGAIDLEVRDESAPEGRRALFESSAGLSALRDAEADAVHLTRLDFGGRTWALRFVARPGTLGAGTTPWIVGALGLLLTFAAMLARAALEATKRLRAEIDVARELGQYRLVRKIGQGGMGTVYEAEHALLRRPTAVKMISDGGSGDALERFEREAKTTSLLTHPNTVVLFDFGRTADGVFYYAMEFLDGVTVETLVRRTGPLPPERAAHLLRQIAGSLAEAHAVGLVHRDVKPQNLMICERGGVSDFVKVLDFGLVKDTREGQDTRVSQVGQTIGTPRYMAPEVLLDNAPCAPTSDVYALAAVAYFMLTGVEVVDAPTLPALVSHHVGHKLVPPSARCDRPIPPALEAWVMRGLARDPTARPANASEQLAELDRCGLAPWTQEEARRVRREIVSVGGEASSDHELMMEIASGDTIAVDYRDRVGTSLAESGERSGGRARSDAAPSEADEAAERRRA